MRTVYITMGLPGSGKTTWSKENSKSHYKGSNYMFDFDRVTLKKTEPGYFIRNVKSHLCSGRGVAGVIIDGLFLTYQDIFKLLKLMEEERSLHVIEKLSIQWWKPDVEACLHNDKGRREESAATVIKNAQMDTIDSNFISKLEEDFPVLKGKIVTTSHDVVRKPEWKVFAEENDLYIDDDGKVKGSSWCLGGSWGDCWGNHGTVRGEAEPETFSEFDELLEKVCPNISFLQYKNIYAKVVRTEEFSDGDYYGGSTNHACRWFYASDLYEVLKEKQLIPCD